MFTGIVEATGEVVANDRTDEGVGLRLAVPFAADLAPGQSVAVSGACLTVEDDSSSGNSGETADDQTFSVFLSRETVERTYLGDLTPGDTVNVERALPADGRFDGHFVQGHVDGVGEVTAVERVGDDREVSFAPPASLRPYVVEKGSVAVDGVSLTVTDLRDGEFTVALVPTTLAETTLGAVAVGDPVHLEVDVVAKYVESLLDGYA